MVVQKPFLTLVLQELEVDESELGFRFKLILTLVRNRKRVSLLRLELKQTKNVIPLNLVGFVLHERAWDLEAPSPL